MIALPIIGFCIITVTNYATARFGYNNMKTGDRDILFPFSTMIFIFTSLLIYLPEVHGKITSLYLQSHNETKQMQAEEQQGEFPIAFLLSLLSITTAVYLDKFCLNKSRQNRQDDERNLQSNHQYQQNPGDLPNKYEAVTLKYFLSLAILFINVFNAYFVTLQKNQYSLVSEVFIIFVFGTIINFAFGYLLAWTNISEDFFDKLLLFINLGTLIGVFVGLVLKIDYAIVILPCISVGFSIYSSVFICFPKIFTNGQKSSQDKFRYWSIFTALLLTIIYYPILYLLKI